MKYKRRKWNALSVRLGTLRAESATLANSITGGKFVISTKIRPLLVNLNSQTAAPQVTNMKFRGQNRQSIHAKLLTTPEQLRLRRQLLLREKKKINNKNSKLRNEEKQKQNYNLKGVATPQFFFHFQSATQILQTLLSLLLKMS